MVELYYTFGPIWTNLLTQCTHLPVPVFCCFFFRFSGYLKCPKNSRKIILKISIKEPSGRTKRGQEVHHQGSRRVPDAAPPWAAPGGLLAALGGPRLAPSPIFTPRPETLGIGTLFRELLSVPPPPPFQDWSCLEKLLRHPAGRDTPSGRPSIAMDASRMCRE